MTDYAIIASQTLFDSPGVRILRDTVEHQGRRHNWFHLQGPSDGIACVALTGDGQIVLTRQYRHAVRAVILDLPGGRANPGETLAQTAARELEEETGYRAARIELLGRYCPFPGSVNTAMSIFLATGLAPGHQHLDEGEELEVVVMPAAEALQRLLRGELIDGSLQLGLLLAAQKGLIRS